MASQIRYQLAYLGIDYLMMEYQQGDGPEFSREDWYADKHNLGLEFPSLPYFFDGETKLTDPICIQKYICRKWDPALLGTNLEERAHVNMISAILGDLKAKCT